MLSIKSIIGNFKTKIVIWLFRAEKSPLFGDTEFLFLFSKQIV